ncbi:hypothetical protein L6164_018922 [Bauhinia variegata]|uniref:Uncharacterized protein n=2 Tax=Bauhinia variegata TaxID=167791 RepID=A0ACB9NER5_BAUVA|nr:hypothetical protein L6164_018922 [Bauhinia variegata]
MTTSSPTAESTDSTAVYEDSGPTISSVHPDIIHNHILNRLDGPTLASTACASSQLRRLCTEETLWRKLCISKWPSTENPLVQDVVTTFSGGQRSLFADSFSVLGYSSDMKQSDRSFLSGDLISAVDIYYQDKPIFSKVHRTETQAGWFLCSPFWIDLLDPEDPVPTPVKYTRKDEELLKHLEDNLSLSWIAIDPTQKRAANLSSWRPVLVQRHWMTRDLDVLFAVVMASDRAASELVQFKIKVTCSGKVGGDMQVNEVSLMVEDMDGRHVNGKESMVILRSAMENGKRKKVNDEETKVNFDKFSSMKKEKREMKQRIEKAMDMASIVIAISMFIFFCWFMFA